VTGALALHLALVAAVGAERLVELLISRRNLRRVAARGGLVADRRTFWEVAAFQVAWLAASAAEPVLLPRPFVAPLAVTAVAALIACQGLRYWAVATLGDRWSLRIVVVPGEPAARAGPYRFVRHPNYLAVMVETLALPLLHTAWLTAATSLLLAIPLWRRRARVEEAALVRHSDYERAFAATPRGLP
jgi:methyltransferase